MANNYYRATLSPDLPANIFSEEELESLSDACGLKADRDGDDLYFFAEEYFCEEGEDRECSRVNCLTLLQEKLKLLDANEYPHIVIEGAATCSKMRPGEFGGFALFITREEVRGTSTWQWVNEQSGKEI